MFLYISLTNFINENQEEKRNKGNKVKKSLKKVCLTAAMIYAMIAEVIYFKALQIYFLFLN